MNNLDLDFMGIAQRAFDLLKSSRAWAAASGQVAGLSLIDNDYAKALVILGLNGLWIASETILKLRQKP